MPVGEWEEVARCCAQIASFPPATPFSAPGGEGSPGTLGTRQATPRGAWLWRGAGWGGSPHLRATSRPMMSPAFGSGADYLEGSQDSEAFAAQLQYTLRSVRVRRVVQRTVDTSRAER